MTLLEDLQYELNRNKLLLSEYEAIPAKTVRYMIKENKNGFK